MRIALSIKQDFLDLLSATGGIFYGDISNRSVSFICTDSRECEEGDIFFALEGEKIDANIYIPEAIRNGAIPVGTGVKHFGIRVPSGINALLSFASFYKNALTKLKHTVAITGSVGKTTTKEFTKILSGARYKTHSTRENYNNAIGASITVLTANADTEVLILELGMNHQGEIERLSRAFSPTTAVITKIGSSHIGNLGSIEKIAQAKLEITSGLTGKLFIPKEEKTLITSYPDVAFFSTKSTTAEISVIKSAFNRIELYRSGTLHSIFDFEYKADHILECLAAAISIADNIGISPSEIIGAICTIRKDSLRHEIFKTKYGFSVLNDSYNASYESVKAALMMMDDMTEINRRHALLGSISELGSKSYSIHYSIGKLIAESKVHFLFLYGNDALPIADGAIRYGFDKERIFIIAEHDFPTGAAELLKSSLEYDDIILIKASHKMNFESIVRLLR